MDQNREIICTFFTDLQSEFKVSNDEYSVPTTFGPEELRDLLISLLQQTYPETNYTSINFDFKIDGQVIRTNLEDFITQLSINREKTIIIEYLIQLEMPQLDKQLDLDDWVYKIFPENEVLTCLANGNLNIYKKNKKEVLVLEKAPAKAYELKGTYLLSSYLNKKLRIDNLHLKSKAVGFQDLAHINLEHFTECIAACNTIDSNLFCAGLSNGEIQIYDFNIPQQETKQLGKKRVKVESSLLEMKKNFQIHKQSISAMLWNQENTLITGSYDHQVHIFDFVKEKTLTQYFAKNSVPLALDILGENIIVTGHEDGLIRLWDRRLNSQSPFKQQKNGQYSVSCLKAHSNQFLAGSFDGTVNVWDARSELPLFTLKHPKNTKVLSVTYDSGKIYCGGSDCKLNIYNYCLQ